MEEEALAAQKNLDVVHETGSGLVLAVVHVRLLELAVETVLMLCAVRPLNETQVLPSVADELVTVRAPARVAEEQTCEPLSK